jgi:hypothetical protein
VNVLLAGFDTNTAHSLPVASIPNEMFGSSVSVTFATMPAVSLTAVCRYSGLGPEVTAASLLLSAVDWIVYWF